jgi:4-diphosphocytidyl-2-C-methyl-D-erythritol kinase
VFKALNAPAYHAAHHEASLPTAWNNVSDLLAFVKAGRNDLEKPAVALVPLISEVLDVLRAQPGCLLSRLSGSGPTCFALFESRADAEHAASAIQNAHNGWWVAPTTFS